MTHANAIGLLVLSAMLTGCAGHIVYPSGPFHGKVVDAETKQPLAGAAIVAVWYWEGPGLGHAAERLYDAREVVTDTNGEFTLPRTVHVPVWGSIREPDIVIYYPGYKDTLHGDELKMSDAEARALRVVELRRAVGEERRRYAGMPSAVGGVPDKKMPNLIRLVNVERRSLGLRPVHVEE